MKSNYNSSGVHINFLIPIISKGDTVIYRDTVKSGKKNTRIDLYGIWDGEKVCFNDNEKTVVRNILWLKKSN